MSVAPFLPFDMPLIVGTEQIADHERRGGRTNVSVIEPPVDLKGNAPGIVDGAAFRREHGLSSDAVTVVCVSRLSPDLKLEGLLSAIEVAGRLADGTGMQLVIAGDGPSRADVATAAERANATAGRRAVVLTGELRDPRPAYEAADVCLGMGGSALRAMAFARPLVVQGEGGFWELLTPDTLRQFLWTGWYGYGDGREHGPSRLQSILGEILGDADRRETLGAHARRVVEQRFSLAAAAERQVGAYEAALADAPVERRSWLAPGSRSARRLAAHRMRSRLDDVLGRLSTDDFNARAVARVAPAAPAPSRD
jgi:glycosyltransferase involved in cell wall biosynthesis